MQFLERGREAHRFQMERSYNQRGREREYERSHRDRERERERDRDRNREREQEREYYRRDNYQKRKLQNTRERISRGGERNHYFNDIPTLIPFPIPHLTGLERKNLEAQEDFPPTVPPNRDATTGAQSTQCNYNCSYNCRFNCNSDDKDGHLIVRLGSYLNPRYQIIRLLGEGTFGRVVECFDEISSRNVAIKIVKSIRKYHDAAMCEITIFNELKKYDPENKKGVIHLLSWFEVNNHVCMVFEVFGKSVFDFLKDNLYSPFPLEQIREFAKQILTSVCYVHSLKMIHTDIKPENVLLVNSDFETSRQGSKVTKSLLSTQLKLIDFGSTIFENDYHGTVVCTRHYRAPEIILELGWSYPSDLWSVGCMLLEFYTGDALFQTHDNLEHLAMMEKILGKIPKTLLRSEVSKQYFDNGAVKFPSRLTTEKSENKVKQLKKFEDIRTSNDRLSFEFFDLLQNLLEYDPAKRIDAKDALNHSFFCS